MQDKQLWDCCEAWENALSTVESSLFIADPLPQETSHPSDIIVMLIGQTELDFESPSLFGLIFFFWSVGKKTKNLQCEIN